MTIAQTVIPPKSLIGKYSSKADYADCFSGQFTSEKPVHLESVVRYFLNQNPWWINLLVKIRNILVKPFGLKTDYDVQPVIHIQKGGIVSIFEVLEINEEEVLLFIEDKHLNAYVSIILNNIQKQYEISVSTTVQFRNLSGHFYFFFVKPFHILIVKSMLQELINHFSNLHKSNKL